MGWTHYRLAKAARDPAERREHAGEARKLWTQIDQPDLVAMVDALPGGGD
ncbi:MAG: hypothetical protein R3F11_33160 [Verrucomicrobiales bacterium]